MARSVLSNGLVIYTGASGQAGIDLSANFTTLDALISTVAGKASTSHTHAASDITSGTFADARISESSVTQHQGSLVITESQISDLGAYITALSEDTTPTLGGNLVVNGKGIGTTDTPTLSGSGNVVVGGTGHVSNTGSRNAILGGTTNEIKTGATTDSAIIGGANHDITTTGDRHFIGGGSGHLISGIQNNSAILGGTNLSVSGTNSVALGGTGSTVTGASSLCGSSNTANVTQSYGTSLSNYVGLYGTISVAAQCSSIIGCTTYGYAQIETTGVCSMIAVSKNYGTYMSTQAAYSAIIASYGGSYTIGTHTALLAVKDSTTRGTHNAIIAAGNSGQISTALYSAIVAGAGAYNIHKGSTVTGAGFISAAGAHQTMEIPIARNVTHSTSAWSSLHFAGITTNRLSIPTDSCWVFEALITGATSGMAKTFAFKITGCIENDGGTTAIKGTPTVTTIYDADDTSFDARATADDTNDALLIEVSDSGAAGDAVRWSGHVKIVQVKF